MHTLETTKVDVNTRAIGTLANLTTTEKENLVGAINEVRSAVAAGGTAAQVTMTESTPSDASILKAYTIKQGETTVGTINIPKDMVVQSGEVVTNPEGMAEGTYIKLVLANANNDEIFVNVGTLVDIYKPQESATQVQLAIDSATREVSASIVAGSIGTTELADDAVTNDKIANSAVDSLQLASGAVTNAKLAVSAVATNNIRNKAVDADKIANNAVQSGHIGAGQINIDHMESALKVKINQAHSHDNKTVLNGITEEKVAAWDAAEQNAKDHATGLNDAMNERMLVVEGKKHEHTDLDALNGITATKVAAWDSAEANAKAHADGLNEAMDERMLIVEGKKHEHANATVLNGITDDKVRGWDTAVTKAHGHGNLALLETYTQTEADLADAVSKKHAHSNAGVLNGITGDKVATWDAAEANAIAAAATDATTKANKAKSDAVTAAAADATTKANQALADAKLYAD